MLIQKISNYTPVAGWIVAPENMCLSWYSDPVAITLFRKRGFADVIKISCDETIPMTQVGSKFNDKSP